MSRTLDLIHRLEANVSRALVGKPEVVRLAVVGLLARGHLLIEDVPGVGKTTLAAALARSIGASFQRIQYCPLRHRRLDLELNFAGDFGQHAKVEWQDNADCASLNCCLSDHGQKISSLLQRLHFHGKHPRQIAHDGLPTVS